MSVKTRQSVAEEVGSWPGVTIDDRGENGLQFLYGTVELGHMHGRHVAHLPMPRKAGDALVEAGRATAHPALPDSGWVQRLIATSDDTSEAIALFRMNYDRVTHRTKFSTRQR